jgi:hypothetical protein
MRRSWLLQRELDEATARETYFRNRTYTPRAYQERAPRTPAYYRSVNLKSGTDHLFFDVSGATAGFALFGGTAASGLLALGLLDALPANTASQRLRGSGMTPSKVKFFRGVATPTRETTAWNTRYTKYYATAAAGSQSHYSLPISEPTGTFDTADVVARFQLLFDTPTDRNAVLNTNGAAQLVLEKVSYGVSN